ncbi:MAG: hypothetical protein HS115_16895 [Spirochaetales bacterium]|nr:hypothetical protein [Spirochaetales bacterium]
MKKAALCTLFLLPGFLLAQSHAELASDKRKEMIRYLRHVRPMVFNFPCEPFPVCQEEAAADPAKMKDLERIKLYDEIKRIYQEGLVFFFEKNYVNAYSRFLDSQKRMEGLLEGISQSYLDRTSAMVRDAIERKDENAPDDLALVDISIEYGPNSRKRRDFQEDRAAPNEARRYDPRTFRYAKNKYHIEKNMEKGYEHLGLAREARTRALTVDSNLTREQKLLPVHRKNRIEMYMASVHFSRLAKQNAEFLYQLKYPFDNYALHNPTAKSENRPEKPGEVASIAGQKMVWTDNTYMLPKNLNPVFDLRVPERYRKDAADARNMIYSDEVDVNILFKYSKVKPNLIQ